MSFQFANPGMLWGTALAAVPLLVHLFNRKRARPHPFAAIDFVLRSRRRTARRWRLKRLVLFAVRTLLLLALPVALARPQRRQSEVAAKPQGPAATALVLDTSLSMSYRLEGRTLLERAKVLARETLASLAPEDPITLVLCDPSAPPPAAPGFERARIREAIDRAPQTFLPQDVTACVAKAARALAESTLPAKRIALATDLTAASFRLDVPAPTVATPQGEVRPEVVLLDAAGGAAQLPNTAVTHLSVEAAPAVGQRAYQLTLTVANHSAAPLKDATVLLRVGKDVVAKSFVDAPARGTAVKTLTYRFPASGVFTGTVELAHDALEADDVRHFAVKVPREVRALVVDGEPNPVRFLDEAFFVEAALSSAGSPVHAVVRDAETAAQERFADYDAVLLLNVRALPAGKVAELKERVAAGAGLFISLGDQIDGDSFNAQLGELLPRPLHLVKTASEASAAHLAQVMFEHPAFSVFTGEAREGMLSAKTYRYFLLAPGDASQVTALATYDDGAPALLEARRGKGRVVLYTSTVDRAWTDWPIRTSFLPAMQRLAGWLAGVLDEKGLEQVLVGEPMALNPPADAGALKVLGPDQAPVPISTAADGKLLATGLRLPGVYSVRGAAAPLPEMTFSVNVDPRESDLARLDERELRAYFGEKTRTQRGGGRDDAPPPFPLWSVLLAAAAMLLATEGVLLRT